MMKRICKVFWVANDGTEHLTETEALLHELYLLYEAAINKEHTKIFYNSTLGRPIIQNYKDLAKLFLIEPKLLDKIREIQENYDNGIR